MQAHSVVVGEHGHLRIQTEHLLQRATLTAPLTLVTLPVRGNHPQLPWT